MHRISRGPSSSRTRRCSFAHTRALLHSANRRWAVAPDSPKDADGNCCQVQPDVATNTIAANTSGRRAVAARHLEDASAPPAPAQRLDRAAFPLRLMPATDHSGLEADGMLNVSVEGTFECAFDGI